MTGRAYSRRQLADRGGWGLKMPSSISIVSICVEGGQPRPNGLHR